MCWAATTKYDHQRVAHIPTTLDRNSSDRTRHGRVDNLINTKGRIHERQVDGIRHLGQGMLRVVQIYGEISAQQCPRVEIAQDQIGVGYCGLVSTTIVAYWPGNGAGTARSNVQLPYSIIVHDAPAACSNFRNINCGNSQYISTTL